MKKLIRLFVVCLGAAFAFASIAQEEQTVEPSWVCTKLPFLCQVSTMGGNGGGSQPPDKD